MAPINVVSRPRFLDIRLLKKGETFGTMTGAGVGVGTGVGVEVWALATVPGTQPRAMMGSSI